MRPDSFTAQVIAVVTRRDAAHQPLSGEPSTFAGQVMTHRPRLRAAWLSSRSRLRAMLGLVLRTLVVIGSALMAVTYVACAALLGFVRASYRVLLLLGVISGAIYGVIYGIIYGSEFGGLLVAIASIVTGGIVASWLTLVVATAAMARSQEHMEKRVRYWQARVRSAHAADRVDLVPRPADGAAAEDQPR